MDILDIVVLMKYFLFLSFCKMAKRLALQVFLSLAHHIQVSLKKCRHGPVNFLSPPPPPLLPPPSFLPHPPSSHPRLAAPQKVMS